jgi:protein-S-isoprenylcysteine O-methyltransferase Ste14
MRALVPVPALIAISVAWFVWSIPFFGLPKAGGPKTIDKRARWGIALEGVGFMFVWSYFAWAGTTPPWRWVAAVPFLVAAPVLSWTSARVLGRQWRFDAGLNADHSLVQHGAYRVVRHPIYASMFALVLGTGLLLSRLRFVALAAVFFVIGTEIRVRIEDALLASRFGATFEEYKARVPAYIPFIR